MTASYLFASEGVAALNRYLAADTLFAFDLDGTLAPIVAEYGAARIAGPVRASLQRLGELAKVAVITGRSRQDALSILGFEPLLLIGNHGAEWPPDGSNRNRELVAGCLDWRDQLARGLKDAQGVEMEFKGASLTLHYRKSDDREKSLALISEAISKLVPAPRVIGGKYVVNLLPMDALTKGDALVAALAGLGLGRAIFFGDDVTDEEVFRLENVDVLGVHIGKDDRSAAPYYLDQQSQMTGLLDTMVGALELPRPQAACRLPLLQRGS